MSEVDREPEVVANSVSPVLPVRDIGVALSRYESMGFVTEAYRHDEDSAPFYGFVCMGPTEFHVARVEDLSPGRNTSAVYLYVDDADAIWTRWNADGLDGRLEAPVDTDYGLREFCYVDPDGNLFRVGSPLDRQADRHEEA